MHSSNTQVAHRHAGTAQRGQEFLQNLPSCGWSLLCPFITIDQASERPACAATPETRSLKRGLHALSEALRLPGGAQAPLE